MCRTVHQRMLSFDDASDRTQGFRKLLTGSHSGKLFALHIFRNPSFQLLHVCLWPGIPALSDAVPFCPCRLRRLPLQIGNSQIKPLGGPTRFACFLLRGLHWRERWRGRCAVRRTPPYGTAEELLHGCRKQSQGGAYGGFGCADSAFSF